MVIGLSVPQCPPCHTFRRMVRRTSILILAAVVSVLTTQPVPVRAERAADAYAILWQSEARASRPAEVRFVASPCRALCDFQHPAQPAPALLTGFSASLHSRAPPSFSLAD